ncbi:MAG: DUF2752 domain-containing protein [Chloroflexi bacterium]|nr:DUF2752 domain-containing protein [Chloroflexota bacterium]
MNATFNKNWYAPTFSGLLEKRREGWVIVGVGALHLGLSLAGLPAWSCPILAATGVPCPGCGLTRATMQLIHGDFSSSFRTHAFAPIFLFAMLVMIVTLVLPEPQRVTLLKKITDFETRSGITAWVLSFLMLYWAFRLIA